LLESAISILPSIICKDGNQSKLMRDTIENHILAKNSESDASSNRLSALLDAFVHSINSKFYNFSEAFQNFDQHKRMRITYEDFCVGLENIDIHLSV